MSLVVQGAPLKVLRCRRRRPTGQTILKTAVIPLDRDSKGTLCLLRVITADSKKYVRSKAYW